MRNAASVNFATNFLFSLCSFPWQVFKKMEMGILWRVNILIDSFMADQTMSIFFLQSPSFLTYPYSIKSIQVVGFHFELSRQNPGPLGLSIKNVDCGGTRNRTLICSFGESYSAVELCPLINPILSNFGPKIK